MQKGQRASKRAQEGTLYPALALSSPQTSHSAVAILPAIGEFKPARWRTLVAQY